MIKKKLGPDVKKACALIAEAQGLTIEAAREAYHAMSKKQKWTWVKRVHAAASDGEESFADRAIAASIAMAIGEHTDDEWLVS